MKLRSKPLLCLTMTVMAACSDDKDIVGVFTPGASGLIVLTQVHAAGGQLFHENITVDSATARFEVVTCTSSGARSSCRDQQRRVGDVAPTMIRQLFATAQSSEFQTLREAYDGEGNVIPPDGSNSQLSVTVGEQRRTVRWASRATLPAVLTRYECWLHSVRGSLALCG